MGIRETQIIGLSPSAMNYLDSNAKKSEKTTCSTCGHSEGGIRINKKYSDARDRGMFDDGPDLHEYELKDGKTAKEIVQATPWSSGPCIFLCLEVDEKRIGEWSDEELDNC